MWGSSPEEDPKPLSCQFTGSRFCPKSRLVRLTVKRGWGDTSREETLCLHGLSERTETRVRPCQQNRFRYRTKISVYKRPIHLVSFSLLFVNVPVSLLIPGKERREWGSRECY